MARLPEDNDNYRAIRQSQDLQRRPFELAAVAAPGMKEPPTMHGTLRPSSTICSPRRVATQAAPERQ
jgi:hypothetical protein